MAVSALKADPTPRVAGLPIVGSTPELLKDPAAFLVRSYREHGPVFRVRLGRRRITVLAGPELARFMGSREGQAALRSREVWHGLDLEYGAERSVMSTDGAEHRMRREVMRPGYSREALSGRLDDLVTITDSCLDRGWRPGTLIPVLDGLQDLVTSQLGTIVTGSVPRENLDDIRTFTRTLLNVHVVRMWPRPALWTPRYRRAKARVLGLADRMLADLAAGAPAAAGAGALVHDLVRAHHDHPEEFSRAELVSALLGPYVAGLDTVANTMGGLVYLVLKHPDVLARIQAEADALFDGASASTAGSTAGSTVQSTAFPDDVVAALPATHGAVQEALRLYPVAVLQPRTANRDFTFAGHRLREGEAIYCAVGVTHFLEEFFPQPQTFDVDRYSDARREHARPGAYAPYGKGPHTCLGKGMADVQMTLTAARLFHRLDLALDPPGYVLRRKAIPTPGPARSFAVRVVGVRRPGGLSPRPV